ncbi:hypothetical protein J7E99_07325 [Streptomyces sp. ISL-44]|uniref:hypothetical protein n=1 Tax=Streptomyces sp. ISL-44 TaxID=2819184 RepID=UPI001BE7B296|nr:hypothetical protein [Streptomyces sp. ISL-44]MBT2540520.1 hypothetical protein [Streptomyces sp. ISL-44]
MEIMKKLKARAARAQRVLRNQLVHSSGERLIAESIAGAMPTLDVAGVMARSVSDMIPKLTARRSSRAGRHRADQSFDAHARHRHHP